MTTCLRAHNLRCLPTCFAVHHPTCSQGAVSVAEISDVTSRSTCVTDSKKTTYYSIVGEYGVIIALLQSLSFSK
jgi:hypothetical protein